MVGVCIVHLVMVAVFAYLAGKDREADHMRLWGASWALGAGRDGLWIGAALLGGAPLLVHAAALLSVGSTLLLLAGTYRFVRRPPPGRSLLLVGAAATAWILLGAAAELAGRPLSFWLANAPIYSFFGAVYLWTGAVVLRDRSLGDVRVVMGAALVAWGVHVADYPFLREVAWFAPWGFALASVLGVVVAVGMLLLYFERAWAGTRRSEARYRSIFENAIEGMFQLGADGRFLAVNPALVRMLGYAREEELLQRSFTADLLASPRTDAPAALAELATAAVAPEGAELELVRRDGERLSARAQLRAVAGAAGLWEGSIRDVTQARRLQEQLLQVQKLEALGRLAGGVAHDFNNVLTAILAGSELAERMVKLGHDPAEELRQIRAAGLRAAELTQQLLSFSRRQSHQPRPLDLNAAAEAAVAIIERLIGEDIALLVQLSAEAPVVMADPAQVQQIVLNLAINARDAMPAGGGLELATDVVREAEDGAAWAVISVRDEGEGMDEQTRARIFEPFFTTKPPGKGTGLGLSTVYGVVTSLGGKVEVASSRGQGAAFRVFLPLIEQGASPSPPADPPPREPRATVLLVEDDTAVRELTARVLAEAGHRVLTARDASEGLAAAEAHSGPLELLLTDVVMPGGSGVDLACEVRTGRPAARVLFVSGYDAGELERIRELEGVAFLPKPFSGEALLGAVDRLLSRSPAPPPPERAQSVLTSRPPESAAR